MAMGRTQESYQRMIGGRIAIARGESGMTQEALSKLLGFKDRQILSNIESGKRKLGAEELTRLLEVFGKPLDYFMDPLLLVGEGEFCWRADAEPSLLDKFEEKAKSWIAAYRLFCEELNEPLNPIVPRLGIGFKNSYEDVWSASDFLLKDWNLGDIPAQKLIQVAESRLGILVLYIDAQEKISGAACRLTDLNTVIINRQEPDGRRNFDFAHELFHLLTWQDMPPGRFDGTAEGTNAKRREQLANNFAAAILMPRRIVKQKWESRGDCEIHKWLNETAEEFGVTSSALKIWLSNLGLIGDAEKLEIHDDRLTWNGKLTETKNLPNLYSRQFVEKLGRAIEKGYISVRRSARILDCQFEDMEDLFKSYDLPVPFAY